MTILKVIIPKGEMPKSCKDCDLRWKLIMGLEADTQNRIDLCPLLLKEVSMAEYYSGNSDCPLEEEKDGD